MQIGLKYEGNGHATFFMSSSGSASASLEDLQSCDYKALFSTVLGRVPALQYDAPPLTFGIHLHTSQQIRGYYELDKVDLLFKKLKFEPFPAKNLQELQRKILLANLEQQSLPIDGKRTTSTLFKLIEDYQDWSKANSEGLEWLLFRNSEGELEPAIEQSFALPFTNTPGEPSITFSSPLKLIFLIDGKFEEHEISTVDIIYQGVFDNIRSFYDTPFIGDYKTSSETDPDFFIWREFSNQFIGYVSNGRETNPRLFKSSGEEITLPIEGMLCDKLTFAEFRQSESYTLLKSRQKSLELCESKMLEFKDELQNAIADRRKFKSLESKAFLNKEKMKGLEKEVKELQSKVATEGEKTISFNFERRALTNLYSEDHCNFWRNGIIIKIQNFLENHARAVYPQNRSACKSKWGMCPYFRVCIAEPATHFQLIMGPSFQKKEFKV